MNATIPCICKKGVLSVEVTVYGNWRIDSLVAPCPVCGCDDIQRAQETKPTK